jgi:hypothetical protein
VDGHNDIAPRSVALGVAPPQLDPIPQPQGNGNLPLLQCASIAGPNFPMIFYQIPNSNNPTPIKNLTLDVGPGAGTVSVYNTFAPTTIINDGPALVVVGAGGSTQGIQGPLTVTNTVAHGTMLQLNDSQDPTYRQVNIGRQYAVSGSDYNGVEGAIAGLGMPSGVYYDLGSVGCLDVFTGTGGALVVDADYITPTSLIGSAPACDFLLEQNPMSYFLGGGYFVRAGGHFNMYGNLSFSGF